jgi:mRNA-degrading endonuclease RelE of RelBE toxin-antitoxin system
MAEKKELTVEEKLQKELNSLKRDNKKLQKEVVELAKNSGPIKYTEASIHIEYELDDTKKIKVGLSRLVGNSTPEEAHENLYLTTLQSLGNIIDITEYEEK